MKFFSLKFNPELDFKIKDVFPTKFRGDLLYFIIPEEFDNEDFKYLSTYFYQKIKNGIRKNKPLFHLNASVVDKMIKFDVLNLKEKPENCMDLSIYYQFHDWVVVRSGIFEESFNLDIDGFEGFIVDFYNDGDQDIFKIIFGMQSLNSIPKKKLASSINKNISPFYTFLSSHQILPSLRNDSEFDIYESQIELLLKYSPEKIKFYWQNSQKLIPFENNKSIFDYWESLFKHIFAAQKKLIALTKQNEMVRILSTAGSDERYGVWINIFFNEKELIIPLSNILRISTPLKLNHDLKIYNYWVSQFLS